MALSIAMVTSSAAPVSGQQAPADSSGGRSALSVSPAIIDNALSPGATFTTQITLANVTDSPMAIHANVSGLVPDQNVDPAYKAAYDASPWFTVATPDFLVLPQQQQVESVQVTVPKDAEPGGHYATIYFEAFSPNQASSSASTSINARVGVLTLLTIKGAIAEHATTDGPIKTQSFEAEAGPTNFDLSIKNDGNVHLLPYGTVTVTNIFGQKVKTIPLPLGYLLPGTSRDYNVAWEHGLRFGYYKVQASVVVGTQHIKLSPASTHFTLFPLVVFIPAVVVLLILMGIALAWRRRRRKRRSVPEEIGASQTPEGSVEQA